VWSVCGRWNVIFSSRAAIGSRELFESGDGLEGTKEHGGGPWRARHADFAFPSSFSWTQRLHHEPQNTDPRKTDLFAKFDWPRVSCPHIDFSLPESEREADVIAREQKAERESATLSSNAASTFARSLSSRSRARAVTIISRRMAAEIATDWRRERDASHP